MSWFRDLVLILVNGGMEGDELTSAQNMKASKDRTEQFMHTASQQALPAPANSESLFLLLIVCSLDGHVWLAESDLMARSAVRRWVCAYGYTGIPETEPGGPERSDGEILFIWGFSLAYNSSH